MLGGVALVFTLSRGVARFCHLDGAAVLGRALSRLAAGGAIVIVLSAALLLGVFYEIRDRLFGDEGAAESRLVLVESPWTRSSMIYPGIGQQLRADRRGLLAWDETSAVALRCTTSTCSSRIGDRHRRLLAYLVPAVGGVPGGTAGAGRIGCCLRWVGLAAALVGQMTHMMVELKRPPGSGLVVDWVGCGDSLMDGSEHHVAQPAR